MLKKRKRAEDVSLLESREILGDKLSFAASEAYKLLRANLMFSLPDEAGCKIIGVTSSLRKEGKTTTAINMAYVMAQTGRRVVLIEGDLRLPTIAKRLKLKSKPGVSNVLAGQCRGVDILQTSPLLPGLTIVTAGDIPPNLADLLGSEQMRQLLKMLAENFDVIIVDLPPITAVSDALVVSKLLNGIIIVVRQDYCDKATLDETVRQVQFADAKILGFVVTGSDILEKSYKRYSRYKKYNSGKYGYDYSYGYSYGYEYGRRKKHHTKTDEKTVTPVKK